MPLDPLKGVRHLPPSTQFAQSNSGYRNHTSNTILALELSAPPMCVWHDGWLY